ncbi:MAG: hypothetical protein ACI8RZ_004963 [Myxococcota bacterium]|jgi:hypothetical protein
MLTHTTALLSLLAGCHVFADGEIPLTCDDLADCGADSDTDSGTPSEFSVSAGIALSMTDGESWLAIAYDPPDLNPRVQKGGLGSTAGAVAWSADRSRLFLADDGALLQLGPNETDIKKFELPTLEPVLDMAAVGQSVFLITDSWIIGQLTPSADPVLINSEESLGFISMVSDGALLTVATSDNAGPDLYRLDPKTSEAEIVAEDFDSSADRVSGDLFFDAEVLMSCSNTGSIYDLDDLLGGGAGEPVVSPSTLSLTDVLTCGVDPDSGRYFVISASQGLIILAPDEDDIQLDLTGDGYTLGGAQIY